MATELATALGVDVAKVKQILDANRPAKPAFTTIEAAHKAEHAARETAMYAAVAKELGLSADAVRAAFEANRPARRAATSS